MRNYMKETCKEVALHRATQESGHLLSEGTRRRFLEGSHPVAWLPGSKYCLYLLEITEAEDMDIDRRFKELPRPRVGGPLAEEPEIVGLDWVPLKSVLRDSRLKIHRFSRDMFVALDRLGAFETVIPEPFRAAPPPPPPPPPVAAATAATATGPAGLTAIEGAPLERVRGIPHANESSLRTARNLQLSLFPFPPFLGFS
jgi:hypothetical protein